MYHYKLFYHAEIFRRKGFGVCKSHMFFIGDQDAEARRRSERPGSHSANLDARRSF